MPHITIEYSDNLAQDHDIDGLVSIVHDTALSDGLPPLAGLRTRAVARSHYRVATGESSFAFVAILARIGPGRPEAAKSRFLTAILDAAEAALAESSLHIAFSAELQEIDPNQRINRNHIRPELERRETNQEHADG